MKNSLRIGRHQVLEPKEILRERCGQKSTEYLVKWSIVTQSNASTSHSDASSTSDGKNDKNILVWMTNEEVNVCCSELVGSCFIKQHKESPGDDKNASESDDFEDMRDDVQKLVIRARRQLKKTTSNDEHQPVKNISNTLKVLSTYASLGSLASVFRETGALDLILELLWFKEVETRRHAGKMLRALASHDAGSRAYVLLSLIQDRHGQMTSSDHGTDFENRNTVMEMFAETSSGEEANAVSLDFMQLPQIPGKALFKLMKCYLKVTSLLEIDSQFGDLMSSHPSTKILKKEMPKSKASATYPENHKFKIAMAISDLIYELCEVMGWNNKSTGNEASTAEKKAPTKAENEDMMRSEVISKYKSEFSAFVDSMMSESSQQSDGDSQNFFLERQLLKDRTNFDDDATIKRLLATAMSVDTTDWPCTMSRELPSTSQKPSDILEELIVTPKEESPYLPLNKNESPSPTLLSSHSTSHCIFASKRQESLDTKLLAELIKKGNTSTQHASMVFRVASTFPSQQEYVDYLRENLRQGWHVRITRDEEEVSEGDEGVFRKFSRQIGSVAFAEVYWFRLAQAVRVPAHYLDIIQGKQEKKELPSSNVPEYLRNPENLRLWPVLIGQDVNKLSCHPYSCAPGLAQSTSIPGRLAFNDNANSVSLLTKRQWWEVLFFLGKINSKNQGDIFRKIHEDLIGETKEDIVYSSAHVEDCVPHTQFVLSLIRDITTSDPRAESILAKSAFCSRFLKSRERKKKSKLKTAEDENCAENLESEISKQLKSYNDSKEEVSPKSNEETVTESSVIISDTVAMNADVTCSDSDGEDETAKEDGASASDKDEKYEKVHDYLFFICHQTTRFLNTFTRYKTLRETFRDFITPQSKYFKKDTETEEFLDNLASEESTQQVIMMIFLQATLMRTLHTPFSNQQLNQILFKLQPVPQSTNMDLCIAWMECIRIILAAASAHAPSKMRGTEVIIATSGCLSKLLCVLKWFPTCIETTMKSIQCLSLATRAVKFFTSSENPFQTPESQIIREVVSSIESAADAVTPDEGSSTSKSELSAFFDSLDMVTTSLEKCMGSDEMQKSIFWSDIESNSKVGALYEGLCVYNMLVSDHDDLMKRTHDKIVPIVHRGLKLSPESSPLWKILNHVKGKVESFSLPTEELFKLPTEATGSNKPVAWSEKLEVSMNELLDPENFPRLTIALGKLIEFLKVILYDDQLLSSPHVARIINTLFPCVVFPNMNQKLSVNELSQCIDIIEHLMFESDAGAPGYPGILSPYLEEKHRPLAISSLLQMIETLCANPLKPPLDSAGFTQLKEVITKNVSLLQRIADADRDSAVVMCGLEEKQFLPKAVEKYDSIPKASELIEFLSSYDRFRSLHSKLLVVVLGGTIGIALRCMEDARRKQESLEIPFLDRLFESLCQGSDFDMKEDKCWERMEVSSNQRQCSKLTDGNFKTYWESNGSSGSHWINVYMKKGVIIRKMVLQVSQEDSSYMPARFVIMGGTRPSDITHQLNQVTVSSTDSHLVVLENDRKFWPIIRICIRRCQQGGIDTRIRGIEIVGPKPSFWPVLRQQLCVRTCLAYFIRARAWIALCMNKEGNSLHLSRKQKLMNHGILDLSSRITQAIQHEQSFADAYLPNDESALVIGQAFRNAVINPLVTAVLDEGISETEPDSDNLQANASSQCLIFQLLSLYLDTSSSLDKISQDIASSSSQPTRMDQLQFLSRLRCLTRLLVDLNPVTSVATKRAQHSASIKDWRQKMQSKVSKDNDSARTARSKVSSPSSIRSLIRASFNAKNSDPVAEDTSGDELFDLSGIDSWCVGLIPLGKQWYLVTMTNMHKFLTTKLQNQMLNINGSPLEKAYKFCEGLVEQYTCMRTCTSELFGSSVQFLTNFMKGITAATRLLDVPCTAMFSRNCALTIHKLMLNSEYQSMTKNDTLFLEQLVEFVSLASGPDSTCIFGPLYCTLLSSRLLKYDRFSLVHEKRICNALRPCFPHDRPVLMLQDIEHSKLLWKGFLSYKLELLDTMAQWAITTELAPLKSDAFETAVEADWKKVRLYKNGTLNARVVSPISWRLLATQKQAVPALLRKVNSELLSFIVDYERFFMCAYASSVSPNHVSEAKPLHWTGEGWAEVHDVVTGRTFRVTTTQMLLLLHFNNFDRNEEVEISEWKKFFPHHWEFALDSLCKGNVLERRNENTVALVHDEKLENIRNAVNDLTMTSADEIAICSKVGDIEQLTEQRNNLIDCAIVHCIKKKNFQIDALVHMVIKQCLGEGKTNDRVLYGQEKSEPDAFDETNNVENQHHFLTLSSEVRARCELLIDLGYMKRDAEKSQIVCYVPEPVPIRSRTSTIGNRESVTDPVVEVSPGPIDEAEVEDKKEHEPPEFSKEDDEKVSEEASGADQKYEEKENDQEEEVFIKCSSSAVEESPESSSCIEPGAIPKKHPEKSDQSTGILAEECEAFLSMTAWQLIHGMSSNPSSIVLQQSCRSFTKDEVVSRVEKCILTISEVFNCNKRLVEALLLQMDWRVDDLIEHYTTKKSAALLSVGVVENERKFLEGEEGSGAEEAPGTSSMAQASSSQGACCPVCTNDLLIEDSLALQCNHRCCMDCWKTYLSQKLDDNLATNTKCPISGCDARPTTEEFQEIFGSDSTYLARYKTALVRSYVENDRSLTWCHCPVGCETVVRKNSSWSNIGTCSVCGWETCFACTYVEAHYPASCGHMSQWMEDGGYYDGMGDDARSKHLARLIAKRCPNCQANIEKDDGCLHMKCLKCSHDFCWRCLKSWRPTHRDYYKCTAKVSKLAHAGMRFQEHNKKCQFHHKAMLFSINVLKRLMTVSASPETAVNLSHAMTACIVLLRARKVLAYCNVFSYYSTDTEHMNAFELYSQVLENNVIKLQTLIDRILLHAADINHTLAKMSESDHMNLNGTISSTNKHLRNLMDFATQDMKIASSPGITPEVNPDSKQNANGPPLPSSVILNVRPAGMSDEENENDIFGAETFQQGALALEGAVDRLHSWAERLDRLEGVSQEYNRNDDDDEDDDDADNFPSSSDDSFSDDDDDEDDDEDDDDDDDDDSDADNRVSDDTVGTDYGMDDEDILDRFM